MKASYVRMGKKPRSKANLKNQAQRLSPASAAKIRAKADRMLGK